MKTKLSRILKDKKAEMYIDSLISIFIVFLCLALVLAVLPVIISKQQLDIVAKESARYIEVSGSKSGATSVITDIGSKAGCVPDNIDIDGDFESDGKMQLRDEFTVTLEKKLDMGFGITAKIPITISSTATGRSEVYWKDI